MNFFVLFFKSNVYHSSNWDYIVSPLLSTVQSSVDILFDLTNCIEILSRKKKSRESSQVIFSKAITRLARVFMAFFRASFFILPYCVHVCNIIIALESKD